MPFIEAKLRAYAGNELDPSDAGALEETLAAKPELARRAVLALLEYRLAAPVAASVAVLDGRGTATGHAGRGERARPPAPNALFGPLNAWPMAAGLAAVMLLVGLGYFAGQQTAPGAGTIGLGRLENTAVQTALERVPTGGVKDLRNGRFRAVASFIAADGSLCRQFTLSDGSGAGDAVACRRGKAWAVTFALMEPSGGGDYVPADGGDPISAYLQELGASRPLTEPTERELLQGRP